MENMGMPENPAYKSEDLEIKNDNELDEARQESGVKTHKKALEDAKIYAKQTGDELLEKNAIDLLKREKINDDNHEMSGNENLLANKLEEFKNLGNKKDSYKEIKRIKKELVKILPITFIYRSNDLFDKHIPQIEEILSSMNFKVNIYGLPKETERNGLVVWYREHEDVFKDTQVISDYTCSFADKDEVSKGSSERGVINRTEIKESGGEELFIDIIFNEISSRALLGNDKYEKIYLAEDKKEKNEKWSEEKSQLLLTTITKKILEDPQNKPKAVYIFIDNILDHTYEGDEAMSQKKRGLSSESIENLERLEAKKIKEYLIEAGLEQDRIIISQARLGSLTQKEQEEFKKIDDRNNWIIVDRHASEQDVFNNAIKLNLPAGNFYMNAKESELIPESKSDDYSEAIEATLERLFN